MVTPGRTASIAASCGPQHQRVDLTLTRGRPADHGHPRQIAPVAIERGAEIKQHEIARLELATCRVVMRESRSWLQIGDRGLERTVRRAPLADGCTNQHRQLELGLPRPQALHHRFRNSVGDGTGARHPVHLGRALGATKAADRRPDVDQVAGPDHCGKRLSRLHRQVLLLDSEASARPQRPADEGIWVLAVPPSKHGSLLAIGCRHLLLQRRHHEGGARAARTASAMRRFVRIGTGSRSR